MGVCLEAFDRLEVFRFDRPRAGIVSGTEVFAVIQIDDAIGRVNINDVWAAYPYAPVLHFPGRFSIAYNNAVRAEADIIFPVLVPQLDIFRIPVSHGIFFGDNPGNANSVGKVVHSRLGRQVVGPNSFRLRETAEFDEIVKKAVGEQQQAFIAFSDRHSETKAG